MTTARALSGEREDLVLRDLAARLLGLLCLLIVRRNQAQLHILLERPVVCTERPLGIRHTTQELEEAVARRVVQFDGERLDGDFRGAFSVFVGFLLLGRVAEHSLDFVEELLDFVVGSFVLDPAQRLVLAEIGDYVSKEAFDGGELSALGGWEGEVELRDDNFAVARADDLTIEILAIANFTGVEGSLRCTSCKSHSLHFEW